MQVGDLIQVNVIRAEEGFAIVEYQGFESTLMQTEITYAVEFPLLVNECVEVGELITVKVTAIEGTRFSVSLKQMAPNPWLNSPKIGEKYNAPITNVADYGYFIKIEWFCLGLLLNENSKAKHALGETVSVVVTRSEADKKRVYLNEL